MATARHLIDESLESTTMHRTISRADANSSVTVTDSTTAVLDTSVTFPSGGKLL